METPETGHVQRAVGARYEVLDLVGVGGMGAVFRARHRELGHLVAIKVLPPEIATSRLREERFRREARLAAQISHPNLVPVYEFDHGDELSFLIMPFVPGRTLESLLAERPRLPLAGLLRILTDVGAALDFAHDRGIVHRDVKPANILIEEETHRALLTDFGIALSRASAAESLTAPGTPIGTPAYMAPEQVSGADRVDRRADLYALALVAYEALTGELPTAGVDRATLAARLHERRRDVRPGTATALVAPLAERPVERPDSAAAWLRRIERASQRPRRWVAAVLAMLVVASVAAWLALGRPGRGLTTPRSLAVMPFTLLGPNPWLTAQLPAWFLQRLSPVPQLQIISAASVDSLTGGRPLVISEAESAAVALKATYFLQPSLELQGQQARLTARLYETKSEKLVATGDTSGPADSLSQLMDALWSQLLTPILRRNFARVSSVTLPHSLVALLAYARAEEAFRRGDFSAAMDEYGRVLAADSSFAIAYFRRAIVIAQVDPREEILQEALVGAQRHQSGLTPADSVLLEGYRLLLVRGDGRNALARFTAAAERSPDQPEVWFVLGEFYYHYGQLFDQSLLEAEGAFNKVLDLSPNFAPALPHLAGLAHLRGDQEATKNLITAYEAFRTPSVVAEAVGIADTLLFHGLTARAALLKTLGNHSFTALENLVFQAEEFGTPAERQGPGRAILRALESRATTDSQQVLALRLEVVTDLREGWLDSARARLGRVRTPATEAERDMWLVLLPALSRDSLGEWRSAAARLDHSVASQSRGGEIIHWLLARLNLDRDRHFAALQRLAADSSPLPLSLKLDLEARRALGAGDSARALRLWTEATRRYAVLRVPFDLTASLWWLRRDLARLELVRGDTVLAARTCGSFDSLIGFVDLLVQPEMEQFCRPLRSVAVP